METEKTVPIYIEDDADESDVDRGVQCPSCGELWEHDCDVFGCWSCGFASEDK